MCRSFRRIWSIQTIIYRVDYEKLFQDFKTKMERVTRLELATFGLENQGSTIELYPQILSKKKSMLMSGRTAY